MELESMFCTFWMESKLRETFKFKTVDSVVFLAALHKGWQYLPVSQTLLSRLKYLNNYRMDFH